ncbi:MAG: glycogen debranching N-terminal domain-containing protein, partial [Caulobacteraceae bacterium]
MTGEIGASTPTRSREAAPHVLEEPSFSAEPGETFSIKQGDTFVVADAWGDVFGGADGLFHNDTRILSRLQLLIGGARPSRLSAGLSRDNSLFTMHGANHRLPPLGGPETPRGVIHIERKRCLAQARLFEQIRLTNHGLHTVMTPIALRFAADFRDMFEVRGAHRLRRGILEKPQVTGREVVFGYQGLDGAQRSSVVSFSLPPGRLTQDQADFLFSIERGESVDLILEVATETGTVPDRHRFEAAVVNGRRNHRRFASEGATVTAADGAFEAWLRQSRADVATLTTTLETGPYPYAGIPWFSTTFGRDGIITAWQLLWLDPALARGVLTFLARHQATTRSAFADASPGKILHEARRGEMATLKEIPFGVYYGGVDTTPLFIALAGAYLRRTDDAGFVAEIWPALLRASAWIEDEGDSDGDG